MLNSLKPTKINRVIDLVQLAGIDTSEWKSPSNPQFCYNWAFKAEKKIIALCAWYDELKEFDSSIILELNLRRVAEQLGSLNTPSGSRSQRRAISADNILRHGWNYDLPVRLLVCDGKRRDLSMPDDQASAVKTRELDPAYWSIVSYDSESGACRIIRETALSTEKIEEEIRLDSTSTSADEAYTAFANYLATAEVEHLRFTFEEIEEIYQRALPPTARKFRAWWANSRTDDTHSWAHKWLAAGWERRSLDMASGVVFFSKVAASEHVEQTSTTSNAIATANSWTRAELYASVEAYLDMLDKDRALEEYSKTQYYQQLSSKFGRTAKAFEFRMQNISYVLSLMGREWLSGLKPAKNVGVRIAAEIETLISEIEGQYQPPIVAFEANVDEALKNKFGDIPEGTTSPNKTTSTITVVERLPEIKAWVLDASNGKCECCNEPAPFQKSNGYPYLEVHHLRRLADGGSDRISNAVAICPNCHRELHYGIRGQDLIKHMYERIPRLQKE